MVNRTSENPGYIYISAVAFGIARITTIVTHNLGVWRWKAYYLNATGAVGGDIGGADVGSGNIGGGGVVGENTHEYPY